MCMNRAELCRSVYYDVMDGELQLNQQIATAAAERETITTRVVTKLAVLERASKPHFNDRLMADGADGAEKEHHEYDHHRQLREHSLVFYWWPLDFATNANQTLHCTRPEEKVRTDALGWECDAMTKGSAHICCGGRSRPIEL